MDIKSKSGDGSDSEEVNSCAVISSCYRLKDITAVTNGEDADDCSDSESESEVFHDCDNCDDSDDNESSSDCFQYKDAYLDDRDLDSLEYDYEPGIHLSSLEFSRIIEIGHCHGCRCNQEAQQGHCPSCSCHQESGHIDIHNKNMHN